MTPDRSTEFKDKSRVALSSVAAGLFLTVLKLVAGFLTGSLGILAEAAHSALDLGAAAMTYFAVRAAAKPPDEDHNYGHQRVENISALGETILLLVTCVWIVIEAVRRLVFAEVHVEVNVFALGVVVVSIVVDWSRSGALRRAAVKYKSQALEADALHFSTDIMSSAVVLAGLVLVWTGQFLGGNVWLERADAVAALGVALIVVFLSIRLGRESIDVLMDRAPRGLREEISKAVLEVPGVTDCLRVRVRRSGPDQFLDIVIAIDGAYTVDAGHQLADHVEERVRRLHPRSDVVVHVEPVGSWRDPASAVRGLAAHRGRTIHDLAVHETRGEVSIDLHVEVPPGISLAEAHGIVDPLEQDIRRHVPAAGQVNVHIEPLETTPIEAEDDTESLERIRSFLQETAFGLPGVRELHDVRVRRSGQALYVSLHVVFDGGATVKSAHNTAETLEDHLRRRFPEVLRVLVHTEPAPARRSD